MLTLSFDELLRYTTEERDKWRRFSAAIAGDGDAVSAWWPLQHGG